MHEVIEGDCLDVMRGLADGSVQTCVTSPPYFNLRDYGIAGQIGVERTLDEYVARLIPVFREVFRILRDDGTLWLNLGDSYGPNKQLQLVPTRIALALQGNDWILRSDIVWHKPNPMPESVRDRPTRAHEYIFLLAKRQEYYYDADAIKEQPAASSMKRIGQANFANQTGGPKDYRNGINPNRSMRQTLENFVANPGRNKRDVWTVTTKPLKVAHFATFPPDLIEPCILAGTSKKGACPDCGAPWRRVSSRGTEQPEVAPSNLDRFGTGEAGVHRKVGGQYQKWLDANPKQTVGWEPSCTCGRTDTVPCVAFDPFCGAGTTGLVAAAHGRAFTGIELNPDYCAIARRRIAEAAAQPRFEGVA